MANYKLSSVAKADLQRIYAYGFLAFGETQADEYFLAFFDAFERIAEQPLSFQAVDHLREGYRRCVCGADSIYFRIVKNQVEVMAIIGGQSTDNIS